MLSINGKKFMNLPEAVQWLLNNNALPFQCKSNYVANTIIAKSDIINPSPAEIKVGSLVLFADGKVGTVSGTTDSGFMVGTESTDLSDGVPHITDIQVDSSAHLIITMSEGDPIDAGLIKEVSSLSIDASQHLIANYNDGTSQDLGAIFQGDVNIAGRLTADSIIENMSGYDFYPSSGGNVTREFLYVGAVKNGNKLTLAVAVNVTRTGDAGSVLNIGSFQLPPAVMSKLFPSISGFLSVSKVDAFDSAYTSPVSVSLAWYKSSYVFPQIIIGQASLVQDTKYFMRFEITFLLSDSLA